MLGHQYGICPRYAPAMRNIAKGNRYFDTTVACLAVALAICTIATVARLAVALAVCTIATVVTGNFGGCASGVRPPILAGARPAPRSVPQVDRCARGFPAAAHDLYTAEEQQ